MEEKDTKSEPQDPRRPHKEYLRKGGIEPNPADPAKEVPLDEPYGAESGKDPDEIESPDDVSDEKGDPPDRKK